MNRVLMVLGVGGAVCVVVMCFWQVGSKEGVLAEVWVRARFVEDETGAPIRGMLVRTVPTESVANREWVDQMQEMQGPSGPQEVMFVSAFGFTGETGAIVLKVRKSSHSETVEPFHGVRFLWIGRGRGMFIDTSIGQWTKQKGHTPDAVLELGTLRVGAGR